VAVHGVAQPHRVLDLRRVVLPRLTAESPLHCCLDGSETGARERAAVQKGTERMRLRLVRPIPGRMCPAVLAVAAALTVPLAVTACQGSPAPSAQDQRWRRDITYLASELPKVRVDGLGPVTRAAWHAAAGRLEAAVPRLTYGQLVVGLARMVAMLHDDETQLDVPRGPVYPAGRAVVRWRSLPARGAGRRS
jgi:hypothetical protein